MTSGVWEPQIQEQFQEPSHWPPHTPRIKDFHSIHSEKFQNCFRPVIYGA